MPSHCIRHTALPGSSKLFTDLLYHFDRVADFYDYAPFDPESYRKAAKFDFPAARRAQLVRALAESNPGNPSLDKLAQAGTVAVVTGQQVGLFSGPAYTLYKVLTAVRLAKHLDNQGIPAVPVFWLATEDHDLPEINQAWAFGADPQPVGFTTAAANPKLGPVGDIIISDPPLAELRAVLDTLPFGAEISALVEKAYSPGASFGDAFRKLMAELLEPYGVLFVDPMRPEIRELMGPLLAHAAGLAPKMMADLAARNAELTKRGYHTQVHVDADTSLFFVLEDGKRTPLRKFGLDKLEDLKTRPEALSPNALLRPVMQDYMLPTIAYVGGPAELAYFAQSQVLYHALLGRMPVMVPRAFFTLVDERTDNMMTRYGLSIADFHPGPQALKERMAAKLVPPSLKDQVATSKATVTAAIDALSSQLIGFDPSLAKALTKSRAKIVYQMEKMESKTARETLRRDERATAAASELAAVIYPHNHLQERFYGILPFLAKYGPDLVGRIHDSIHVGCADHQLLVL